MQQQLAEMLGPPGPESRPPPGATGYWTDGRAELYAPELAHDGELFFFDDHADTGVITTHLFGWIGQDL